MTNKFAACIEIDLSYALAHGQAKIFQQLPLISHMLSAVTGKKWPKLYEIKVQPVKGSFGGTIEELCLPRAVPGVPS